MEVDLAYPNRPTEFIDLESGRRLKVNPMEVAEQYRQEMAHWNEELKSRAIQYRIDYQAIDVSQGVEQVLLPYLIKRSKHN